MSDANPQVKPYLTGTGRIEVRGVVARLIITQAAHTQYADAQLDYRLVYNRTLTHHPPLRLTIRARFSSRSLLGTAGFGFGNHPMFAASNPVPAAAELPLDGVAIRQGCFEAVQGVGHAAPVVSLPLALR